MSDSLTGTSRFISFILRHKPEVIGITPDEHGWADVDDMIAGINLGNIRLTEICWTKLSEQMRNNGILITKIIR